MVARYDNNILLLLYTYNYNNNNYYYCYLQFFVKPAYFPGNLSRRDLSKFSQRLWRLLIRAFYTSCDLATTTIINNNCRDYHTPSPPHCHWISDHHRTSVAVSLSITLKWHSVQRIPPSRMLMLQTCYSYTIILCEFECSYVLFRYRFIALAQ